MTRVAAVLLALLAAGSAAGHSLAPADVIAAIRSDPSWGALVTDVARDPREPRLLVVRAGRGWRDAPPARRLAAADAWRAHWRGAVPGGIVGVIDAATGRTLVNYDARGRARLTSPTPRPAE